MIAGVELPSDDLASVGHSVPWASYLGIEPPGKS
jgi:hypothetical protein